jgi:hypothetical protein
METGSESNKQTDRRAGLCFKYIICYDLCCITWKAKSLYCRVIKRPPWNRPWRPIGLWDVEAPTFSLDSRVTDGGKELHNLNSSPSVIIMIKSRRMRWAGYVARMGDKWNAYRILVGKPEGKRPVGRPRRKEQCGNYSPLRYDAVCTGRLLPTASIFRLQTERVGVVVTLWTHVRIPTGKPAILTAIFLVFLNPSR